MTARWLFLAALLAIGCGSPDTAGSDVAPGTFVYLPSDSPGYAAQQAWGMGLRAQPTFEFLSPDEVDEHCSHSPDSHALGCFNEWQDGSSSIVIRNDLDETARAGVLLHEVGHAIRPDLEHITQGCSKDNAESQHVMCAAGMLVDEPTEGDFAWATQ